MFKKIAFTSGVPLIIVDLMIYLCGGYNNKLISDTCREATDLLIERVAPIKIHRARGSVLENKIPGMVLGTKLDNKPGLKPKKKKIIPPLKDLPEEEHSDSSTESTKNILKTVSLEKEISDLKRELNFIEDNLF